ncbi:MAG: hypothetical protein JWQ71_1272 [Pedosphaera sp.]|nr:hypothetical protein [Pedosphaera sp.]
MKNENPSRPAGIDNFNEWLTAQGPRREREEKTRQARIAVKIQQQLSIDAEIEQRELLVTNAELWAKCERLRGFIAACEARMGAASQNSPERQWVNWARRYVDTLDPLNSDYLEKAIAALPVRLRNP